VKKLHAELHSLGGMGGKKFDLSAPTNYDNADVKVKKFRYFILSCLVKKKAVRRLYIR
jgi:hypothetical protein